MFVSGCEGINQSFMGVHGMGILSPGLYNVRIGIWIIVQMVLTFLVPNPWRRGEMLREVLREEVTHYMPLGHLHPPFGFRASMSWT